MKKSLLLVLSLSLIMGLFVGCGNSNTQNQSTQTGIQNASKEPLKVASDATYKPMEYQQNGEIVGFDIELIKAIGKEIGRTVEVKNVTFDEIFDRLYSKEFNTIISSVTINDKRKETMAFSNPYFESMTIIVTRKDANIKAAKDLASKKVGIQSGTSTEELITKNVANVNVKGFSNIDDALNSFKNKEVDAVVVDSPVGLDFVKQENNPEYVSVEDKAFFGVDQFGIAINKNNTQLLTEINSALEKLKANGEYQKIFDKYFKAN